MTFVYEAVTQQGLMYICLVSGQAGLNSWKERQKARNRTVQLGTTMELKSRDILRGRGGMNKQAGMITCIATFFGPWFT
jgi:hypothetical protein